MLLFSLDLCRGKYRQVTTQNSQKFAQSPFSKGSIRVGLTILDNPFQSPVIASLAVIFSSTRKPRHSKAFQNTNDYPAQSLEKPVIITAR